MLLRPDVRLLTLTGAGGTGKTRLALRVAEECLGSFPDGVWFVDLAAIADPALVVSAIAQVLGVREAVGQPPMAAVKAHLHDKRLLLALDNFEQILEAASAVSKLLEPCVGVKVLVTSRAALRVSAEHLYPVPPLQLPEPERLPKLEALSSYESVRLFIERAQAARHGFRLTDEYAPAVAEICARLDGLPLAIELAAARARLFDPKAMLIRLGDRLKLLSGGPRDAPARQRTLRATVDWSYDLLPRSEQELFARLSVFSGGFTLEAAEAICSPDGELDVLDGVEALVLNSLLRRLECGPGEPRFGMLETVREYAAERLEQSGEAEEIRRVHAEYYLALAEDAEPQLRGPDQVGWLLRLESEHDNLRAALVWALERGRAEECWRLIKALGWFWSLRGHVREWDRRLEAARALCLPTDTAGLAVQEAKALLWRGMSALSEGDLSRAGRLGEECLVHYRDVGERWALAATLTVAGSGDIEHGRRELLDEGVELAWGAGDPWLLAWVLHRRAFVMVFWDSLYAPAMALGEQSLVLARQTGDGWLVARCLMSLGAAVWYLRDLGRAAAYFGEGLELSRDLGDELGIAWALYGLGSVAFDRGDYEEAHESHQQRLVAEQSLGNKPGIAGALAWLSKIALEQGDYRLARELGERSRAVGLEAEATDQVGYALLALGRTALLQSDYERATNWLEESLSIHRHRQTRADIADSLAALAWVAHQRLDQKRATGLLAESLALARAVGDTAGVARSLEGLAAVAHALKRHGRAARLFGSAEALRRASGLISHPSERSMVESSLVSVRSALGEVGFEAAREDGRVMALDRAVEYALHDIEGC